MNKAFFLLFLRVILITYSITLCLEKKLLFWKKVWKKSVRTLYDTFPTTRYVTVTSPLFAYETLKPNYSQAFDFYQALQICAYSKKYCLLDLNLKTSLVCQ